MPNPTAPHTLGPWHGGVDYSKPSEELTKNQLHDMNNTVIGKAGEAAKRLGCAEYNSSAANGTSTLTACGQQRFTAASIREFAISGNKFFEGNSGTFTDRTGSMTISAGDDYTWSLVNARGTLVGHNGKSGDSLIKWSAAGGNLAAWDVDSRFSTAKWVEWFDNRVWAGNLSSGTNWVWYSDINDPETFGANNYFVFGADIEGISQYMGTLVVYTDISISQLIPTGNSDTPYRRVDIAVSNAGGVGPVSGRSIINIPNAGQCFVRNDGVWLFDGTRNITKISHALDGLRYWDTIRKSRLPQCFVVPNWMRDEIWFVWAHGGSQTDNNHIMRYDYSRRIWYGPDNGAATFNRNCGAYFDDLPHLGGYDTGTLFKHETGDTDHTSSATTAIDASFETASPAPAGGDVSIRWTYARTYFTLQTAENSVQIRQVSPDEPSNTESLDMGSKYDAVGNYTIGTSEILPPDAVRSGDTDLWGYDPHTRLEYRNGNASEDFKIRKVDLQGITIGRLRKAS